MLKFGTQKSKAANAISMTALLFSMSVDILTQDMLPHRLCTAKPPAALPTPEKSPSL